MNKKMKILLSVFMLGLVLFTFSSSVFALTPGEVVVNDINNEKITKTGGDVLGIIKVIGIILSVGILMVVGIKYMMGSAQEKAEYKKVFIPYLIGAALLFGASVFAQAIYDIIPKP